MSEGSHTPGPCRAIPHYNTVESYRRDAGEAQRLGKSRVLVRCDDSKPMGHADENAANARRFAACWNACEGIADPETALPEMLEFLRKAVLEIRQGEFAELTPSTLHAWADDFAEPLLAKIDGGKEGQ